MWPPQWPSWSALSSAAPVMTAVLFLGCALLVAAATSPTKGTKHFQCDRCNRWTLTRTLFHSAHLNSHSHMMLVGTMLDWTAPETVHYKKKKRAKSDRPWRNSLGIHFLSEWAHRCSFKAIQASTALYQSTFPVIQIIYSSDTIFPSLLFKRKGQGCKRKALNSHRRILLCSVYSWGRTNLLNATRATQWTAGNTYARTRAEMSRGEQVILQATLRRHACSTDRQTHGLANYTA